MEKEKKELVPVQMNERGVVLSTIEDAYRWAKYVVASGLAPKSMNKPETVMIAIQCGAEVGLPPQTSLKSISVINGTPSIMGKAALALIRSNGLLDRNEPHVEYKGEDDEYACYVSFGSGSERCENSYSVADAKRRKLWGKPGPWSDGPDEMLYWRAVGRMANRYFSDVLSGLPLAETAKDDVIGSVERGVIDVTPPGEPDPILEIAKEMSPSEDADEAEIVIDTEEAQE